MGPYLLLQVTEQNQRVDTAIERWLGRNVTCLILGQTTWVSGQTSVWVVKPMSAHEWWLPGVHCDAQVCPIVTVTPDSTVRQERLPCGTCTQSHGAALPCLSIKPESVWQIARVWPALADLGCLGV